MGESVTRRRRSEGGQILPVLLVVFAALAAGTLMLFQVGRTADLRARATTAADAAALAGGKDIGGQLVSLLATTGVPDPEKLSSYKAEAAAAEWAERNGARLVEFERHGLDIYVKVETIASLEGDGAARVDREGAVAVSEAWARIKPIYTMPLPAFGPGGAQSGGLSEAEIQRLADKAGVKRVHPQSALRVYGGDCTGGGVDVVHLQESMQIAILLAEEAMGGPLVLSDAYRTIQCQIDVPAANPGGLKAAPGRSMHNYGLAIDVRNHSQLVPHAATAHVCQPFPQADYVHFSHQNSPECGGLAGSLGPGGGFPGGASSFFKFDVVLISEEESKL